MNRGLLASISFPMQTSLTAACLVWFFILAFKGSFGQCCFFKSFHTVPAWLCRFAPHHEDKMTFFYDTAVIQLIDSVIKSIYLAHTCSEFVLLFLFLLCLRFTEHADVLKCLCK